MSHAGTVTGFAAWTQGFHSTCAKSLRAGLTQRTLRYWLLTTAGHQAAVQTQNLRREHRTTRKIEVGNGVLGCSSMAEGLLSLFEVLFK